MYRVRHGRHYSLLIFAAVVAVAGVCCCSMSLNQRLGSPLLPWTDYASLVCRRRRVQYCGKYMYLRNQSAASGRACPRQGAREQQAGRRGRMRRGVGSWFVTTHLVPLSRVSFLQVPPLHPPPHLPAAELPNAGASVVSPLPGLAQWLENP
ncbi:hypothetical protein B0T22DRAFT_239845 [Podospora appendiculata]|uniref:Uncharacterized protein n=1 Tax=Podospora appendiculata TaxID=314037 RepID=A0AAE1CB02_9PEZI|nr:hypothetical protein B0T22DRAFT_239845 [Podospora appendiculata]